MASLSCILYDLGGGEPYFVPSLWPPTTTAAFGESGVFTEADGFGLLR